MRAWKPRASGRAHAPEPRAVRMRQPLPPVVPSRSPNMVAVHTHSSVWSPAALRIHQVLPGFNILLSHLQHRLPPTSVHTPLSTP
eukprot:351385-Chlamydomonas_euryale.AAC.2